MLLAKHFQHANLTIGFDQRLAAAVDFDGEGLLLLLGMLIVGA